jgi:hypothetical protein
MRSLLIATAGSLVLLAGAAFVAVATAPAQPRTSPKTVFVARAARPLPDTPFIRTRDCLNRPRTCTNGVGGLELVYLAKGTMPRRPTTATVLTDTDCAPDQNGVSHCSNILRLVSGRRITVRHDHKMMNDPCLSPGERVRLRSIR